MEILKEKIFNAATNETTYRDYTAEEMAKVELARQEALIKSQLEAEKEAARKAVLEKLGLSADEAAALLG